MRCHGGLHLGTIVRYVRHAWMFDCIEFSDTLRWIDVTCDLAFLLLDLRAHGRASCANARPGCCRVTTFWGWVSQRRVAYSPN